MHYEHYYWYFDRAIPEKVCDDIIKLGNLKQEQIALTGGIEGSDKKEYKNLTEEEKKDLKRKRDSNIAWINDQWVYDEIFPYIRTANVNSGWNFQWDWAESCQFTKYKLNQYYGWHQDSWDKIYTGKKNQNLNGKIRKLSVTVNLTEGDEYEGGDLMFDLSNPDIKNNILTAKEAKNKGSVIVFPSFNWHQVSPVTKGTRYSLVIWCCGKPYV
tara:strand:- start:1776 stop:2414 length:639 start_codon:yes stop_codon:yes gene_type:complete